jgi:hypothetical protein
MSATLLILCVAFVADTGQIWMNRRHLQNSADAAALAAVQNLPDVPSSARTTACDYAKNKNAVPGMTMDCITANKDIIISQTYILNDTIKVTVHKDVHLIIGGMFDWKTVSISAHAKALIGGISPSACVFPLAQTPDLLPPATSGTGIQMYTPQRMKIQTNAGIPLALQVDTSSSSKSWETVVGSPSGCNGQVVSSASTKSGNFAGPVDKGLTDRQAAWTSQGNCLSPDPTIYDPDRDGQLWNNGVQLDPVTCYRIIKVPVLNATSTSLTSNGTYSFAHIALFYIGGWCNSPGGCSQTATYTDINTGTAKSTTLTLVKGEIWGYYISLITQGGTDYKPYDGYGPKVAVLVE